MSSGGQRIRGPEHRSSSPFLPPEPSQEQGVAAVAPRPRQGHRHNPGVKKRRSCSNGRDRKRRDVWSGRSSSSERADGVRRSPDSDPGSVREDKGRETQGHRLTEGILGKEKKNKNRKQGGADSSARQALRKLDNHDINTERGRDRTARERDRTERERDRTERERDKTERERDGTERERRSSKMNDRKRDDFEKAGEEVRKEDCEDDEDANRPLPDRRPLRAQQDWEEDNVGEDLERQRELEGDALRNREREDEGWIKESGGGDDQSACGEERERSESLNNLLSLDSRTASSPEKDPFSFLSPSWDMEESESGASHSDDSVFTASISGLSLGHAEGSVLGAAGLLLPGSWLPPRQQSLTVVAQENRFTGVQRGRGTVRRRGVIEESGI
ncbi:hypothetical protein UPYG_G00007330 [Umbra pygmaea]|uniref:Uncharacterized protein n=1 Tax=Umbra pygmaea TaxID=75934 RepID=A0ABD0XWP3_UMBPY